MKKLPSKGKHMVKFGNHSHTKLAENLKDKSSKIIYSHNKQGYTKQKGVNSDVKNLKYGEGAGVEMQEYQNAFELKRSYSMVKS